MIMDEKIEYFKLPFYKRLSSIIIDFSIIVVAFTIFLLPISSIMGKRLTNNVELKECVVAMNEMLLESGLFIKKEVIDEESGEVAYEVIEEITDQAITAGSEYLGMQEEYEKLKDESGLFVYENEQYIEVGTKEDLDKFYKEAWNTFYSELINSESYSSYNKKYAQIMTSNTTTTYTISIVISASLFFVIFPLLNKNGKTLGKLLFKISVVTDNYEKPNKLQVFIRQFFFVVLNFLILPAIISVVISLFEKRGKSLHDYISSTRLIDSNVEKILKEKMKNKDKEENNNPNEYGLNLGEGK